MDEMKQKLQKLDVPPPSEGAQERAINLAVQAFNEQQQKKARQAQGSAAPARLIHATGVALNEMMRGLTMKKAYVFAGSFATLAIVLAVTTMHYSDLLRSAGAPVEVAAVKDDGNTVTQTAALPEVKEEEKAKGVDELMATPNAPGLPHANEQVQSSMAASAPPPAAPPAPVMAADMAAPSRALKKEAEMAPGVRAKSIARSDMMMGGAAGRIAAPGMPYPSEPYYQPPYQGGDKFENFTPNPVKSVAQEPVSTFSIDVDTSSYSFVRRSLNEGTLPQPEAVRVEEMINYFDYDYANAESASEPFKPSVAVFPTPWNSNTKLLRIGIKGYDIARTQKPHSNLVFLIDVSGSMNQPDKLPLVKNALHMLVDTLNPDDTISIVTYAGYSGTALNPTKVADKRQIFSVIDSLGAGGSTAGAAGIEQAYALAKANYNKDAVNRVILATDGDFNVGITNPEELKRFVEQKRESGIFLSILGFGEGNYNDALMQKLAQNGNGNAAYIDTLSEARKVLVEEAGATLFPIAKDVKIQVEFNPAAVSEYRLIGYESRMLKREDFNNDKVDAGEVGSGHAVTAIYEITPAGSKGSVDDLRYGQQLRRPNADIDPVQGNFSGEYAFLKIRYKLPSQSESKLITTPITSEVEFKSVNDAPESARFAAAVAGFGQLLKGDEHVKGYSYAEVIALADSARGKDASGYRSEFVSLVRNAQSRQGAQLPQPMPMEESYPGIIK